jgi:molybdopterin converting factor small subunit
MEKKMAEERQKNLELLSSNTSPHSKNTGSTIVFREEGKPPRELNHNEVVEMLMSQQKQLSQVGQLKELYGSSIRENIRLKEIIETQQKILDEKNVYITELETKIADSSEVIVVNVENN